jgi:hypothetical protein
MPHYFSLCFLKFLVFVFIPVPSIKMERKTAMTSYSSHTHSHRSNAHGAYPLQQPMRAHRHRSRLERQQSYSRSYSQDNRFDRSSREERGRYSHSHPHSRQRQQSTEHLNGEDRCCLALTKPSNAISAGSFSLGALATIASGALPNVASFAKNAALMAAQKPLLYGGIGGMVLGVAIQLGKLCRGLTNNNSSSACIALDCGDVDCGDAACCCLACC